MVDRPVIFSGPMVRALLDGRKTMTRRLAWRCPCKKDAPKHVCGAGGYEGWKRSSWVKAKPGDRMWVRESAWFDRQTIAILGATRCFFEGGHVRFSDGRPAGQAPGRPDSHCAGVFKLNSSLRLTPSIHMPRWASRLTLVVTATKVERLQEITKEDATAEGVTIGTPDQFPSTMAVRAFGKLWMDLHGLDSWFANPEVVALTFTVHKANIDSLPKAEAA